MSGPTDELESWLRLWRADGVGPRAFRCLLQHFSSPAQALRATHQALSDAGLDKRAVEGVLSAHRNSAAPDLEWLEQPGHHCLLLDDPRYPARLREIPDAPPLLFVNGNPALLSEPQLAIVGTRNPTPNGRETAREFAKHLGRAGLVITSGLALGIDAAAHQGALEVSAQTIAVAGTGPDRVYPSRHRGLAHEIAERGALVTEFPVGVEVRPEHFPRRNRIISGLSLGVLVVEAAQRSGSLITARLAGDQGREVFAIPGSIHNPMARGCHWLIRQGAKLVETADDVLEELRPNLAQEIRAIPPDPPQNATETHDDLLQDPAYVRLIEALGYDPVGFDSLVTRTALTPEVVSSMLLLLELHGHVASMNGGMYVRLQTREEHERERP